jgi:hypothetical protein
MVLEVLQAAEAEAVVTTAAAAVGITTAAAEAPLM